MQLEEQLSFLSRQPSPKITGSWSIHLWIWAERAPLGPSPTAVQMPRGPGWGSFYAEAQKWDGSSAAGHSLTMFLCSHLSADL